MNDTYKIVSLYCFSPISEKNLQNLRNKLEKFEEKGLTGLMILAKEGINGTICGNDENINIRNMGIKAVENNIITLSSDQRTFEWASTGRKLITVPFDENPYSALAAWFKTDEGVEVLKTIEKKLA